jgi:hypothetical protein
MSFFQEKKKEHFKEVTGVDLGRSPSHEELVRAWAYQMYEWGKQVRTDIIRLEGAMGFQSGDPGDPPEPPWEFG